MIGKRYYHFEYGWGTIVAETDEAVLIEYDNQPNYYSIIKLEDLFKEESK